MRYLAIIFSIFLFSCSSNNDDIPNSDNPNNGENPTTTDRYKISFQAESNAGEKHFKATYVFNNGTPIVVNYNGNITASGFKTINNIEDIDFTLEMTSGSCYLKNIKMKLEDLKTGRIVYQDLETSDQYIISPDMLTEQKFLNNLYGYPPQNFNPQNNYKYRFRQTSTTVTINYPEYSYKPEILVNKPTRGSLRVVIHDSPDNGYTLRIPNAWSIRDYAIGFCCNEWLSEVNIFNSSQARAYDFILPGHLSNINVNLKGYNKVSATIYLMRKNGTTQTIDVTSTNNNNIVTNLTL
jgi:hypothetical protein